MRPIFRLRKKRSVHLTIAVATLAVPVCVIALTTAAAIAGASTDTQPAGPGTSLSLRVSPRHPHYRQPLTLTGSAPPSASGHSVVLQAAVGGKDPWRNLASGQIGRQGGFRLHASLTRSALIRVVPASPGDSAVTTALAQGGAPLLAATSPRPVQIAGELQLDNGARDILGGSTLRVRGRLLPGTAGRTVRLQARSSHGWRTLGASRTASGGGFVIRSRPTSGFRRRLRVVFAGDAGNAGAVGPAGRLTVYGQSVASWYDDGGATACGFHAGYGVANRSLPCGTRVRLRYGGRAVTAVVDDRGPFVGGRDWDLNQNTAAALGFGGVGTVWTSL